MCPAVTPPAYDEGQHDLDHRNMWALYIDNLAIIERFLGAIRLEKPGQAEYLIYDNVGKKWYRRTENGNVFHLRTNTVRGDLLWYQKNQYQVTGPAQKYLCLTWNTGNNASQARRRGGNTGFPRKPRYGQRTT